MFSCEPRRYLITEVDIEGRDHTSTPNDLSQASSATFGKLTSEAPTEGGSFVEYFVLHRG